MNTISRSFSLLPIILFVTSFLIISNTAYGESFTPPVPDKSKTLPANDGGPDGCDSSRFKCVMDVEAVLDKKTGLIWARNARIVKEDVPWEEAVTLCQEIEIGGKKGWRLPTRDELISLLDTSQSYPALPEGHPFLEMNNIPQGGTESGRTYWSSTEYGNDNKSAWMIHLKVGKVTDSLKWFDYKIWPVRDGE